MGKKRLTLLAEEPPIMVGGGSSTYVWIKQGMLKPEPDPHPEYEIEFDMSKYDCYRVDVDLVSYKTHDGKNPGGKHPVKNRKKHVTRFYDIGSDPDD